VRWAAHGERVILNPSALITGQVTSVEVHNNEHVSRGQVVLRIEDRPYQFAVEVAKANLAIPQHRIVALRAVYRQHLAGLAVAQDVLAYQQRVHDKQTQWLARGVISQLEFDQTTVVLLDARERVLAAQCAIAETLADLDNDPDLPIDQHSAVERVQAELDRAELDLSHTAVTAPVDGIMTNVDRSRVANTFKLERPCSTWYLKRSESKVV
jgi:membrane fusion protein, multidrug efflux system